MNRRRDERGISLVEVMIASVLTVVFAAMGYTILKATNHDVSTVAYRAVNSADAHSAVNELDSDLRNAEGVWLCASVSSGTCTAATSSTGKLIVQNAGTTEPACVVWQITASGLVRTISSVAATVMPNAKAASGNGFSEPLGNSSLIEIDFTVNQESSQSVASDAATVHQLIAPNNVDTPAGTALTGPCVSNA